MGNLAKKINRTVTDSQVEMTEVVLPQYTNALGTVFGGQVVCWIDICAAVSAQRFSRSAVVTASIDSVHFIEPIKQGQVVVLKGQVNAVFKTSMEIGVLVLAESPLTGEVRHAVRAYCTFVALDEKGKPVMLPELELNTDTEKRRHKEALERRRIRLLHRKIEVKHIMAEEA
ncbi:MAG: acyl-CoA thioesterase [bacterium]|nr:acyl-CoA thioesterase [bacterium]